MPGPGYSRCGPQTSSLSWELDGNTELQLHPILLDRTACKQDPRWFECMLELEIYYVGVLIQFLMQAKQEAFELLART